MNIYSIQAKINNQDVILLSIINPSDNKGIPLNEKCIVGQMKNSSDFPSPENILFNPNFITHFHKTIVFFSQFSDQIINLTERNKGGFVYIVDQRNGNNSNPKKEDIIGSFEVQNGAVVSESYMPNQDYLPISEDGAFMLQPELEALICSTAY